MNKKNYKRISIWVEPALYNQIKKNADDAYLKIATYTRQLVQHIINNTIKN